MTKNRTKFKINVYKSNLHDRTVSMNTIDYKLNWHSKSIPCVLDHNLKRMAPY